MDKLFLYAVILYYAFAVVGCGDVPFNNTSFPVTFPECQCDSLSGGEPFVIDYSFTGKNSVYQNGGYAFFLNTTIINKSSDRIRYVRNKALVESDNFNYYYGQEESYLIASRDTVQFLLTAGAKLKTKKNLADTVRYAAPDTEKVTITLYLYTEPKGKVITAKAIANMKLR